MIAKVIAHGASRDEARQKLAQALDATVALGVPTNKAFLAAVLREDSFARGEATTQYLSQHAFPAPQVDASTGAIALALLAPGVRRMDALEQQPGARNARPLRQGRRRARER